MDMYVFVLFTEDTEGYEMWRVGFWSFGLGRGAKVNGSI